MNNFATSGMELKLKYYFWIHYFRVMMLLRHFSFFFKMLPALTSKRLFFTKKWEKNITQKIMLLYFDGSKLQLPSFLNCAADFSSNKRSAKNYCS